MDGQNEETKGFGGEERRGSVRLSLGFSINPSSPRAPEGELAGLAVPV